MQHTTTAIFIITLPISDVLYPGPLNCTCMLRYTNPRNSANDGTRDITNRIPVIKLLLLLFSCDHIHWIFHICVTYYKEYNQFTLIRINIRYQVLYKVCSNEGHDQDEEVAYNCYKGYNVWKGRMLLCIYIYTAQPPLSFRYNNIISKNYLLQFLCCWRISTRIWPSTPSRGPIIQIRRCTLWACWRWRIETLCMCVLYFAGH